MGLSPASIHPVACLAHASFYEQTAVTFSIPFVAALFCTLVNVAVAFVRQVRARACPQCRVWLCCGSRAADVAARAQLTATAAEEERVARQNLRRASTARVDLAAVLSGGSGGGASGGVGGGGAGGKKRARRASAIVLSSEPGRGRGPRASVLHRVELSRVELESQERQPLGAFMLSHVRSGSYLTAVSFLWFIAYNGVASAVVTVLRCHPDAIGGVQYLAADLSVRCCKSVLARLVAHFLSRELTLAFWPPPRKQMMPLTGLRCYWPLLRACCSVSVGR